MPSRRQFLGATATAAAVGGAGCLGDLDAGDGSEPTTLDAGERARGEADPIDTERAVDDPDLEYVESNDTVRYPEEMSGETVVEYGTIDIGEFLRLEAETAAELAVNTTFQPPLPDREYIEVATVREDGSTRVVVQWITALDGSDEVVGEPDIGLATLVDELPRTIAATAEFAGETATHEFPVFARHVAGDAGW
ncbi:twin-arginine translocation signal domain-containing protein [Haloarchaeobius baliensis]|uniref:twin-arginine translocation signal domain-containing protein n=1 Tax=Haloarchaeobius baliensis TaxID=1670458 RepID=UPI003F882851